MCRNAKGKATQLTAGTSGKSNLGFNGKTLVWQDDGGGHPGHLHLPGRPHEAALRRGREPGRVGYCGAEGVG